MLYEIIFAVATVNKPFTMFQCYPRVEVPVSEETTIESLGIKGPLVVEYSDDSSDPVNYLQTTNQEVHTSTTSWRMIKCISASALQESVEESVKESVEVQEALKRGWL